MDETAARIREVERFRKEIEPIRNWVIQTLLNYKDNAEYFRPKLFEVIDKKLHFTQDKMESAFVRVTVEETVYSKYKGNQIGPLERIRDFILKGDDSFTLENQKTEDLKKLLNDILKECVESEQPEALSMVLTWYDTRVANLEKLNKVIKYWDSEYRASTGWRPLEEGFRGNNNAMIRACEKDNFEMVRAFLNHNFYMQDSDFKLYFSEKETQLDSRNTKWSHKPRVIDEKWTNFPLLRNKYLFKEKGDILKMFRTFHATSRPAFLIADFLIKRERHEEAKDPISEAFFNAHIAQMLENKHIEYKSKFRMVEVESKKFLVNLLDLCKNTEEAKLLLSIEPQNTQQKKNKGINAYPRLQMAVADQHMEFVTHDYCQQVLRTCWLQSDYTGQILQWTNTNSIDRIFYVVKSIVVFPIHITAFIPLCLYQTIKDKYYCPHEMSHLERSRSIELLQASRTKRNSILHWFIEISYHYTIPFNRFVAHFTLNIMYMALVLLIAWNPLDDPNSVDVNWYDQTALYFTLAYIFTDIAEIVTHSNNLNSWYSVVFRIFILVGILLKLVGFIITCKESQSENQTITDVIRFLANCSVDDPSDRIHFNKESSPVTYGYGLYGIGMTMVIMKVMYWVQLNHIMGPLAISIKKVMKDLMIVGVAYIFFLIAFSAGLKYTMEMSAGEFCSKEEIIKMPFKSYRSIDSPKYNLTNETDITKINLTIDNKTFYGTVGGVSYNIESNENQFRTFRDAFKTALWSLYDPGHPEVVGCSTGVPRYMGMALWWVYQGINMIILMNLLIALMNTTMQTIQENKVKEWKFARTEIWLKFFNNRSIMPVPLNIIEILAHFFISRIKRRRGLSPLKAKKEILQRYDDLVRALSRRYLIMVEDSLDNEVTKEDLDNAKRDLLQLVQALRDDGKRIGECADQNNRMKSK